MNFWTQSEAIKLCRQLEEIAPLYDCHIGLTGGCLYKDGFGRKDCDIIIYPHNKGKVFEPQKFIDCLIEKGMLTAVEGDGWFRKGMHYGKRVDFFILQKRDEDKGDYLKGSK